MESKERNWGSIVGLISSVFLGLILILAVLGKLGEPVAFAQQIRNEGLDWALSANTVAIIALAVESMVGFALLLGLRNLWVLIPTSGLVALLLFLTGKAYYLVLTGALDNDYDCGCFGVFFDRTVTQAFWQDLFILGVPLVLMVLDRKALLSGLCRWRAGLALLAGLSVAVYTGLWAGLPQSGNEMPEKDPSQAEFVFAVVEHFSVEIDGKEDPSAQVFESTVAAQLIVRSSQIEEVFLLDVNSTSALQLDPSSIVQGPSGSLGVTKPDAVSEPVAFEVGEFGLRFDSGGHSVSLRSR